VICCTYILVFKCRTLKGQYRVESSSVLTYQTVKNLKEETPSLRYWQLGRSGTSWVDTGGDHGAALPCCDFFLLHSWRLIPQGGWTPGEVAMWKYSRQLLFWYSHNNVEQRRYDNLKSRKTLSEIQYKLQTHLCLISDKFILR
jgi:hypothetical protein